MSLNGFGPKLFVKPDIKSEYLGFKLTTALTNNTWLKVRAGQETSDNFTQATQTKVRAWIEWNF
jgi:hypothetical protein